MVKLGCSDNKNRKLCLQLYFFIPSYRSYKPVYVDYVSNIWNTNINTIVDVTLTDVVLPLSNDLIHIRFQQRWIRSWKDWEHKESNCVLRKHCCELQEEGTARARKLERNDHVNCFSYYPCFQIKRENKYMTDLDCVTCVGTCSKIQFTSSWTCLQNKNLFILHLACWPRRKQSVWGRFQVKYKFL